MSGDRHACRSADSVRWDLISLGEVMLRLDPGERRIHTTRKFDVWEGGGEYSHELVIRATVLINWRVSSE